MWSVISVAYAQALTNPSLDGPVPTGVPNALVADDWTFLGATDLGIDGADLDCTPGVLSLASPDGGTYVRAVSYFDPIAGDYVTGGAAAEVTDLVVGAPYLVSFDAAVVRQWGQSTGAWTVTLGGASIDAPDLAVPAGNPAQGPWVRQQVGPFTAVAATDLLVLRPVSREDGTTLSPSLPNNLCNYASNPLAADLLLDGVEIVGDGDFDGLFDDAEALAGTDPADPDTDDDGLTDGDELAYPTDPLDDDTDDDGLLDGDEVAHGTLPTSDDTDGDALPDGAEVGLGTDPSDTDSDDDGLLDGEELGVADPLDADTDDDGLTDGDEIAHGTTPTDEDTDDDGITDGDEVATGTDPTDPRDPGPTTTEPTEPTEPTGADTADSGDTGLPEDRSPKEDPFGDVVGCDCATGASTGPGWWLLAVFPLVGRARRARA
ncbi:MAG: MYXO-CTERM sorting domain-containing protein [Myxococcota bacterium]